MKLIRISAVPTEVVISLDESFKFWLNEMIKTENIFISCYCSLSVSTADLTCFCIFQIRASVRTLNPKEEKYMQTEVKFKRQVFVRNVLRLKAIIMFFIDLGKFIQ
jgi:hypothetical protein